MHMPAGAHVGMEAPLPVQRAVVAWAIMFYSTTMTLVAAGVVVAFLNSQNQFRQSSSRATVATDL